MSITASHGNTVFFTEVTLSSAQLLALNTSPVLMVNPPGAGFCLFPLGYCLEYKFGTHAYSTPAKTNNCFFGWTGQAINSVNSPIAFTGWGTFIENTFSCLAFGIVGNAANVGITLTGAANAGIQFGVPNALTLGDGTLTVTLMYSVVKV